MSSWEAGDKGSNFVWKVVFPGAKRPPQIILFARWAPIASRRILLIFVKISGNLIKFRITELLLNCNYKYWFGIHASRYSWQNRKISKNHVLFLCPNSRVRVEFCLLQLGMRTGKVVFPDCKAHSFYPNYAAKPKAKLLQSEKKTFFYNFYNLTYVVQHWRTDNVIWISWNVIPRPSHWEIVKPEIS